ncbi:MAG: DUF2306 domain-containing protein [Flavobacteriaceae bacterium]|nr:DUF2306 domain-containing protein [Flavobacteriaceae bacterium]
MFSTIGYIHLFFSILAMITGLVVVLNTKGTLFHKRVGYIYVIIMLLLNLTSFFISNFQGFSIFHFFTIVSLVTIMGGMYPTLKKSKNWIYQHYYFMSWSVVGLYCAFWSEVGIRFVKNMQDFWWAVAIATFLTAFVGALIIHKNKKKFFK